MPTQLRFNGTEPPSEDVFGLLLDCHARSREFSIIALRLARQVEVPPHERSEAASRLVHYFTEDFPRHVEDEDMSLGPRLHEAGPSPECLEALRELSRQHADIEALLPPLLLVWRAMTTEPERYPALEPELTRNSERLAASLEVHLFMEEQSLFPEARNLLPPEQAREVLAEMRARRAPPSAPPGGEPSPHA